MSSARYVSCTFSRCQLLCAAFGEWLYTCFRRLSVSRSFDSIFWLRPRRSPTFIYSRRVGLLIRPLDISVSEGLKIYWWTFLPDLWSCTNERTRFICQWTRNSEHWLATSKGRSPSKLAPKKEKERNYRQTNKTIWEDRERMRKKQNTGTWLYIK